MHHPAVSDTRHWVSSFVIGLGLCPFAKSVFDSDRVRYALCESALPSDLLTQLGSELQTLLRSPRSVVETTLLIAPNTLTNFRDFNDFTGIAEKLVQDLGLRGTIQIVGFHPHYVFAQSAEEAPENYTNRSPHPTLHLLREESISEVAHSPEALLNIPERNIQLLRSMGVQEILDRLQKTAIPEKD